MKKILLLLLLIIILIGFLYRPKPQALVKSVIKETDPLTISSMKSRKYPGSELKIEKTLSDGTNYHQFVVSYLSDGLKIYALLTVPSEDPPEGGWPAIVFNHGYIPPEVYQTTERYVAYVDTFARNNYVVLKPDYRGNGNSEGKPEGAYYSPAYTVDVLNALSSIKKYPGVNQKRIGMWGHSLGGNITLRSVVLNEDIKAAVIWGGVVGSYEDLMYNWRRRSPFQLSPREMTLRNSRRQVLINKYGNPKTNPTFWQSIDPTYHLADISAPIQLHTGTDDAEVPSDFSKKLYEKLIKNKKITEYYEYEGADHNISSEFNLAMERSVAFFDKYLK